MLISVYVYINTETSGKRVDFSRTVTRAALFDQTPDWQPRFESYTDHCRESFKVSFTRNNYPFVLFMVLVFSLFIQNKYVIFN